MLRKVIVVFLGVFVGVPLLILGIEHWRGRRLLDSRLAEVRSGGERAPIERLLPPPPPPASNGMTLLLGAARRLGRGAALGPPSMRAILPGAAVPLARWDSWETKGGVSNITWQDLEGWLEARETDFDDVHRALSMPHCRAVIDASRGFQAQSPHLGPVKSLIFALGAASAEAAHRGDFDRALEHLEAMKRLTVTLEAEPLLVGHLVRMAGESITLSRVWDLLHVREWSEVQLRRLDEVVAAGSSVTGVIHGLEGERALFLISLPRLDVDEVFDFASGIRSGGGAVGLEGVPENVEEAVEMAQRATGAMAIGVRRGAARLWQYGWGDQSAVHYLDVVDEVLASGRFALLAHCRAGFRPIDPGEIPPPPGPLGAAATFYARWAASSYLPAVRRGFTVDTQRALTRTDIALRRYRIRHREYPESLSALVPDFMAEVPRDPIDGKELRFRRGDGEAFTLWSVGNDGIDDGGDAGPKASGSWWSGKDAVWLRAVTEDEFARWHQADEPRSTDP